MTQIATVERIIDADHAVISVPRKSACGHDCEECAGCGVTGTAVYATAQNPIHAQAGQKVVVESSSKKLLHIMLIVYILPFALFLLGYFCTGGIHSEALRYLIAIAAFCIGVLPAVSYDRHVKRTGGMQFTIVRLF